jgi:hypothetical protein
MIETNIVIAEYEEWYYANIRTKQTQWTRPDGPDLAPTTAGEVLVEPITRLSVSNVSSGRSFTFSSTPSENTLVLGDKKAVYHAFTIEGMNTQLKSRFDAERLNGRARLHHS